jgi:uncharacterized membrane protein YedE/YeeE
MFDPPEKLVLGLLTGIVFGFLLQKGRVAKFNTILGQLLLTDWTVLKVMTTAIVVGAIGVFALVSAGWASLHIQPFLLSGVLIGAAVFGVGMALFGYCPGTSVAASGEGSRDAMVGVLGMLTGAGIFVAAYPWLNPVLKGLGDLGKTTLPDVLGAPAWAVIAGLTLVVVVLLSLLRFREKHTGLKAWGRHADGEAPSMRKGPLTSPWH